MNAETNSHYLPAFGRLLIATIFILSGISKVAAPARTIAFIASTGAPLPWAGFLLSAAIELGCGTLLVLGYRTRAVAAVLALFCVATALLFHNNLANQDQMINFLKNIAMAGGLLQVVSFGAGAFSIDARRSTSSSKGSLKTA